MPIDYNADGALVYKPNQLDRNRIARAKRIIKLIASHGVSKNARERGQETVSSLEDIENLLKPKEKPVEETEAVEAVD